MNPDQVARMDQAGAYLSELGSIIRGIYHNLIRVEHGGDGHAGRLPVPPAYAIEVAKQLVITSMELGAAREWFGDE